MYKKSCSNSELGYRKSKTRKVKILVVILCLCFAWNTIAFPVSALSSSEVAAITSIVANVVSAVSNGASVWNAIRSGLSSANYDQINISLLSELVTMFASPYNPMAIGIDGSAIEITTTGTPGNLLAFINQNQATLNNQIKRIYDLEDTHLNGIGSIVDQIYTQTYNQNANLMASNTLLSSINYNTSKYKYNEPLIDLFKKAGGSLQTNSFAYSSFNSDYSFSTYNVSYVAFLVDSGLTSAQQIFYDNSTGAVVPYYSHFEAFTGNFFVFYRLERNKSYRISGSSAMRGRKYVPIFMGSQNFIPDELLPHFGLTSPLGYYASIDNKLSGLAAIDNHVDGVEGLLNSISLNTDTVESKLTTIDGHVDDVESKLDLIHEDLQNLPSGGDSNTDIDVDLDLNFVDIAADLGVSVDFLKDTLDTGVDIPDSLALLMLPDYFFTQDVYNTVNGSYPDVELVPLSDL